MNKKVLAKVLATITAVGIMNEMSAWSFSSLANKVKHGMSSAAHKVEHGMSSAAHKAENSSNLQGLADTAIIDGLQGKNPTADLKQQAEGDAVNAIAKKAGLDTDQDQDSNEDQGGGADQDSNEDQGGGADQDSNEDQGGGADQGGSNNDADQGVSDSNAAPANPAFDGIIPATADNTPNGAPLTDNNANPVYVDNTGKLYADANGTPEDPSNYDVDNDTGNPILYDSQNNKYIINAQGYSNPISNSQ